MATITAFIRTSKTGRPAKIRFRLTDGRDVQIFYTSTLSISSGLWNPKTQAIKAKIAMDERERVRFNRSVEDIKHKMSEWYASLDNKEQATADDFKAYLSETQTSSKLATVQANSFAGLFAEFINSKRYSAVRERNMKVLCRDVCRYEKYLSAQTGVKCLFDINKVTELQLQSFERFLTDEWRIAESYPELYVGEQIKQRGRNTILSLMSWLRVFFNWAIDKGYTQNYPFKKYAIEECLYGTPIYLNLEELHRVYECDLSARPKLAVQRDIFVFQSCIGCRVSDLAKLTGRSVVSGVVEYIARKTKESRPVTVRVPLNAMAQEIYQRYRNEDLDAPLLPFITDQRYNDAIKMVCKIAGLDRIVVRLNPLTREPEYKALWEIASSHICRRTFTGNIYKQVRDQAMVSALTGHAPNSRAFARYRNIDDDMLKDMVAVLE